MKFDLSDVSFLIPARIDSRERWENLDAVIKYISNNFDTCIYVLEADCDQKIQPDEINAKFSYHFVYDSSAVYHKTRYVNMLLRLANSTYAVVWDADVIAHPDLVLSGICKLREQKSFLVIPYDGRVFSAGALLSSIFKQNLDLNILNESIAMMHLMYGYYSTGGAFLINREQYLEIGGDNENIIGWGPEDMERVRRLEVLGLDVCYEEGKALYHLWHPRKSNSWYANPQTELKNRQEFLRTCRSDRVSLLQYFKNHTD
jgi:predicted glycosyltransferase involved in capsule biosynthesis